MHCSLSETQYQIVSHPDKVNCNVHKMLALTMNLNTETIRNLLETLLKRILVGALKHNLVLHLIIFNKVGAKIFADRCLYTCISMILQAETFDFCKLASLH